MKMVYDVLGKEDTLVFGVLFNFSKQMNAF